MPRLSRGPGLQGHGARSLVQRARAGGQSGVRKLSRAWKGARRQRRPDAHPKVHGHIAVGGQRDVHVVSQPRHCAVGRQPARSAESELHQLPQRPLGERRPAVEGGEPGVLCSTCHRKRHQPARFASPHAGAGGCSHVRRVTTCTERERQAARDGDHDRRELHELPHGQARALSVGTRPSASCCSPATIRTGRTTTGCW